MSTFTQYSDPDTPAALPGTFFYDGTSIVSPPLASGIRICMNAIKTTTGLDVLSLNKAVGGAPLSALADVSAFPYRNLIGAILAIIQPDDAAFILWDQGEGDAQAAPHEYQQAYLDLIGQLHASIVVDIGRTKATCPFLLAGLGTASNLVPGTPTGGSTQLTWHTIQSAQYNSSIFNEHMIFSHWNIDFSRGDGFHYSANGEGKQGARFAQAVTTLMGKTTGYANWQIVSGQTIDATHTNLTVVHSLGTDFSPESGGLGWEVSGDNGASWDTTATSARINSTTIQLTHPAMTLTSTRIVRYEYGLSPANSNNACAFSCPAPMNLTCDNSALAVPLSPTIWDIRPTPISPIPVPTWRDINTSIPVSTVQSIRTMQLGPENYRKFLILAVTMGQINPIVPSIVIAPNVGRAVTASLVVKQNAESSSMLIFQASLGTDANASTTCKLDFMFASNPFTNCTVSLYTVPFADLSSTTSTGHNGNVTRSSTTANCTVNVSAGGFIVVVEQVDQAQTDFAKLSANYAKRWETGGGVVADASNCTASGSSNFSVANAVSSNIGVLMASWR